MEWNEIGFVAFYYCKRKPNFRLQALPRTLILNNKSFETSQKFLKKFYRTLYTKIPRYNVLSKKPHLQAFYHFQI